MPRRSAAHARTAVVPVPRPATWSPSTGSAAARRTGPPGVPDGVSAALLAWADADDGALVLLEQGAAGTTVVRWVSTAGARLLGYAAEELVGETLDRLLRSPFAAVRPDAVREPLVDPHRVVRRSLVAQRRDGAPLRLALTCVPVRDGTPRAWVVRLVHEPDAERVADDLRASHERFRALADRAPIAIFSSESGLRLAYVNDRFSELHGTSAERLQGMGWLTHVHSDDRASVVRAMAGVLEGVPSELPLRLVRTDGRVRSVQARIVPVPGSGRDVGFVGTLEDVTDREAHEESLAHQASRDPLTGLLNRRRLLEMLSADLAAARRGGPDRPALLFLDLDDFKQVNDGLGHSAGDRLLVEVARRLREAVREGDVVSRFGGDEFAVLCRGLRDEAAAGEVARRLLRAVTGPVQVGGARVEVSGSLGVVVAGTAHLEAEDVLRDADIAMYQAKAGGKDRWALYDEQARRLARERVDLVRDLRRAVESDALEVHYQPVVALTGEADQPPVLASVEALARWTCDERGPVPPADFIAVAEQEGLIARLGLHVLRTACQQMAAWRTSLGELAPRTVSVNVSALQLSSGDFADVVEQVLVETGLPGSALCLELTESVVMHDAEVVAACFWRLSERGVRLALDDFGTGWSSLSVLRQLPFDQLKLDRSLVPDFGAAATDPVVSAVVGLGQALGLAVVAEGVETQEQVDGLRALGCPLAQGFLFARPMPADALERWAADPARRTLEAGSAA